MMYIVLPVELYRSVPVSASSSGDCVAGSDQSGHVPQPLAQLRSGQIYRAEVLDSRFAAEYARLRDGVL